jgi:flagellar biosynthesis/type III secretory pathway M-ring protein FliF/YscJ
LLNAAKTPALRQGALAAAVAAGGAPGPAGAGEAPQLQYEQQVATARGLVTQDPKRGAQVVKQWVSADE